MPETFKVTLKFKALAKKEWDSLNPSIREKFAKLLKKRAVSYEALTMPANRLSLQHSCYKIKLRNDGYRLAYTVTSDDKGNFEVTVTVVAVDRRDEIYEDLHKRLAGK
ncbi:type II toxin-antitoxin system RelE/ParE family toxin [Erwinia sp. JH02]|uniref:type II toxin-antitoxin system RelE family toxin n=1 Tax=Erwinia sp. JH02 TaxID=2733394 RepID=UPI0014899052|nr:type II toxin-antitoxin system RelE/ParE family toxin [Erwinia sp. JH02]NNS10205.1 type II toxin-antitoxin system RelE/ParE family toxin [Erwinia sp. JH02]